MRSARAGIFCAGILFAAFAASPARAVEPAPASENEAVKRGAYIFHAAGCKACHTDIKKKGPPLAGGRAIGTPFGVFFGPNITPDPVTGIGEWSDGDFIRALRSGVSPDGDHYYPVFPYTSFTKMTDRDMLDLKAYIFSLPPVNKPNRPHEVNFPFGFRFLLGFWKMLHFTPGTFKPDPVKSAELNRGTYLAKALGHCAECHSPRTMTGGLDLSKWMAGTVDGPDGETIPNVTPHKATGIGEWDLVDIELALETGIKPDGDVLGSLMGEVIDETTSHLTPADRRAIALYLKSLAPIDNRVEVEDENRD
ncbi:MAG: cytochrome c [Proteobacteria bacterium]|nr:cytochrome c [Pseudomonadota bacterium]MCH8096479.1 cytochrome c [Pseudomonadota bacterium]